MVGWSGSQIVTSTVISIATTYHDAFAPSVAYNPAQGEFLVAFTVNGEVNGTYHSWELFTQRVTVSGTLPGGVENPTPLPQYGTHNWTNPDSLEVITGTEHLLAYTSVREGGGFFSGPYDVRFLKWGGQDTGELSAPDLSLAQGALSSPTPDHPM